MRGVSIQSICLARASNQAVLVVAFSRCWLETMMRVSSSSRGSRSRRASPSSFVGLTFRRRSIRRREAKSEVDCVASMRRLRSKRASMSTTSRFVEALFAGLGAHQVGGLDDEQQLVATDPEQRRQALANGMTQLVRRADALAHGIRTGS